MVFSRAPSVRGSQGRDRVLPRRPKPPLLVRRPFLIASPQEPEAICRTRLLGTGVILAYLARLARSPGPSVLPSKRPHGLFGACRKAARIAGSVITHDAGRGSLLSHHGIRTLVRF